MPVPSISSTITLGLNWVTTIGLSDFFHVREQDGIVYV